MNAQIEENYAAGCLMPITCHSCKQEVEVDLRNLVWNVSACPDHGECPSCGRKPTGLSESGAVVIQSALTNKGDAWLARTAQNETQIFEPAFLIEFQDESWGWYMLGGNRVGQKIGLLDVDAMTNNGEDG